MILLGFGSSLLQLGGRPERRFASETGPSRHSELSPTSVAEGFTTDDSAAEGLTKTLPWEDPGKSLSLCPPLFTGNSPSRRFRCRVVHKNTFGWFAIFKLGHRLANTRWSAQGPGTGGQHKVPAQGSRHKVREPPPAQGQRAPPAQGRHKVLGGRVREEGLPRATIYIYI
jgi:hypothetical protein